MHHPADADALLDDLNPTQREAVTHPSGPLLVFAGAGSGKTRVLTYRIAYLIAAFGVSPHRILAVTFTNKAANEMRERTERLLNRSCRGMWIGTFHSCCARILRESGDRCGIRTDFVIFDDADQIALMRDCLKDLNIDPERYQPRSILSIISRAKEQLIHASSYASQAQTHFERIVARVYERYEEHLRENNALDFDDLLMATARMFDVYPDVLGYYQRRFQHILVDEYQDINYAQYVLVNQLAAAHRNVCVVGDDDQSIYAFRGANVDLMLRFERDYPDARVVKLEQNYRSTQAILDVAHRVVSNNRTRKAKRLWTKNDPGEPVEVHELANEEEEAVFVAERIISEVQQRRRHYGDIAVLYRTNAQSRAFEEVFTNFRVPHRLVGARPFYQRKEVKDIIAYLRVARNPLDTVSLRRIINVPNRGIGATTQNYLDQTAVVTGRSLWHVLQDEHTLQSLQSRARRVVGEFVSLVNHLREVAAASSVHDLTQEVVRATGYVDWLQQAGSAEARDRIENVYELMSVVQRFEETDEEDHSLAQFLEQVALVSDLDTQDLSQDAVTLMTLHSSKGLEFDVVFLVGMEEGLFPHIRSLENERDVEEERRLCYVGVTRARRELILTHTYYRTTYGIGSNNKPSRFIAEMGLQPSPDRPASVNSRATQAIWSRPSPFGSPANPPPPARPARQVPGPAPHAKGSAAQPPFRTGQRVVHPTFGQGLVVTVKPAPDGHEVVVAFDGLGIKHLLHPLAKLEPLPERDKRSSADMEIRGELDAEYDPFAEGR